MSAKQPFFSVVIPTYNRAEAVRSGIESVLAQDFDDWEICIVDDSKSSDDIQASVASYGDERIRVETGYKGTAAAARNRGMFNARGHYVALLDADDEFMPGKLATYHAALQRDPDVLLFSQNYVDRGVGRYWVKPRRGPKADEDIFDYLFIEKGWVHPSTIAVRREKALASPFNEDLSFGDDTQFAADIFRSGVKIRMIEKPLSMYYDIFDPTRLSQIPVAKLDDMPAQAAFVRWVESQKAFMSPEAYLAFRAGFLSRFTAAIDRREAAGDILKAWRGGALSAKGAASQMIQSFNPVAYRRIADMVARRRGVDPAGVERIARERSGPLSQV